MIYSTHLIVTYTHNLRINFSNISGIEPKDYYTSVTVEVVPFFLSGFQLGTPENDEPCAMF